MANMVGHFLALLIGVCVPAVLATQCSLTPSGTAKSFPAALFGHNQVRNYGEERGQREGVVGIRETEK